MRSSFFAATLAAVFGVAAATVNVLPVNTNITKHGFNYTTIKHDGTLSNGTHFLDQGTNNVYQHFNCGSSFETASEHFKNRVKSLHSDHEKKSQLASRAARYVLAASKATSPTPIATIQTYFHVVTSTTSAGKITQAMVLNQFLAMNKAYNPIGVYFKLMGTTFSVNNAWAVGSGSDGVAMKAALRNGTYSTLNLYFQTDLAGDILGVCTLPSKVTKTMAPSVYNSDGCNIQANTMPGGNIGGYNTGMTAVHETGHWLGLLHTFEGNSCSGTGDYVSDTNSESQATNGCPVSPLKNTCSSTGGDPIHNYMDYSTDACYQAFTAGQTSRISTMWTEYRAGM